MCPKKITVDDISVRPLSLHSPAPTKRHSTAPVAVHIHVITESQHPNSMHHLHLYYPHTRSHHSGLPIHPSTPSNRTPHVCISPTTTLHLQRYTAFIAQHVSLNEGLDPQAGRTAVLSLTSRTSSIATECLALRLCWVAGASPG